jgi:hypothetical protein
MRFGTPEQFAGLRGLLTQAEYTEVSICWRRGKSNLQGAAARQIAPDWSTEEMEWVRWMEIAAVEPDYPNSCTG